MGDRSSFHSMGLGELDLLRTPSEHSRSMDVNVSSRGGENSRHSSTPNIELSQASLSEDETSYVTDETERAILDIEKGLSIGKSVENLEQVYILYCQYGRVKGFSVRRGEQRYVGKSEVLRWKEYLCSSAGKPDCKSSTNRIPCYKKLVTRTGCKAKIRISRIEGGGLCISQFMTEHNHPLVPVDQTYMLRSSRNLSYAKTSVIEALTSFGIGVTTAFRFVEKEAGGPQNVGFTLQDAYDHQKLAKRATKVENGDANTLMQYFIDKANKEPYFFWKVQLDDLGRIMNFFFRDTRCAQDYQLFGDILSVDTTHRTNRYNLICAPFVGINHHTLNVMFGMAFLSDETTATFEWLFRTFLDSMNGAEPKIIFTDQSAPMMNAIDTVFPNSKHRLCQWHINRNAHAHFGALKYNDDFKKLWYKCMNGAESEAEFQETWDKMINTHDLTENGWFETMYKIRHRWSSVFTNDTFSAGLHATSRSEGTNRTLKDILRSSASLYEFVKNYEIIQNRWRQKEIEEDTLAIWVPGQVISDNRLLSHAASVYTRNVFKAFEKEFTRSLNVVITGERVDHGDGNLEISVTTALARRFRKLLFNTTTHHAACSCKLLETDGILCRHILKVYLEYNVFAIPEAHILKRWGRRVNEGFDIADTGAQQRPSKPFLIFLNSIIRKMYDVAGCSVENESARSLIHERIENLQEDVFSLVGMPEVKMKRKRYDMSSGAGWDMFRDPEPIREKVFGDRRKKNQADDDKKKGIRQKKNTKSEATEQIPFIPNQFTQESHATSV